MHPDVEVRALRDPAVGVEEAVVVVGARGEGEAHVLDVVARQGARATDHGAPLVAQCEGVVIGAARAQAARVHLRSEVTVGVGADLPLADHVLQRFVIGDHPAQLLLAALTAEARPQDHRAGAGIAAGHAVLEQLAVQLELGPWRACVFFTAVRALRAARGEPRQGGGAHAADHEVATIQRHLCPPKLEPWLDGTQRQVRTEQCAAQSIERSTTALATAALLG
jgi:hypothetical protein